jgi:hypothetical protein
MRSRKRAVWLLATCSMALASACATAPPSTEDLLSPTDEQMKLRSMQTRTFEVRDRRQAMQGVIAALQDLGFIIERANEPLGLVTAARFAEPRYYDVVGVTVTVRDVAPGEVMIRANAIFDNAPITDPEVYQNFFASLNRSMFIGGN